MASSAGHPIFIDTLRRILDALDAIPRRHHEDDIDSSDEQADLTGKRIMSVVELTGPGPFTDSVLRYVGAMTEGRVRWNQLRSLPIEGLRIGDVLILSITAFSPGVGHMGAESVDHPGAFVKHGCASAAPLRRRDSSSSRDYRFAGTWKPGLGQ